MFGVCINMLNPTFYQPNYNQSMHAASRYKRSRFVHTNGRMIKLFVCLGVFVLVFTSFLLITGNAATATVKPAAAGEYEITVSSGDTLWSIARKQVDNRLDVRYAIFAIQERNGLQTVDIKPGQKLIIPKF